MMLASIRTQEAYLAGFSGQHAIMWNGQPADIPRLRAKAVGQWMSISLQFLYYFIPYFL